MIYFSYIKNTQQALDNRKAVAEGFKNCAKSPPSFRTSIETTTKSIGALSTRLQLWGQRLSEIWDIDFPNLKIDNNTGRISV